MPEVTLLRTMTNTLEFAYTGFANLTMLDMEGCLFRDGHYRSSHTCGSGLTLSKLQKVIFRLDWDQSRPSTPGRSSEVKLVFFRCLTLPRLMSVNVILERSPRQQEYTNARCAGEFNLLIRQNDEPELGDQSTYTMLQQIQELSTLVNDDTTAFKDFLHRLKPITAL